MLRSTILKSEAAARITDHNSWVRWTNYHVGKYHSICSTQLKQSLWSKKEKYELKSKSVRIYFTSFCFLFHWISSIKPSYIIPGLVLVEVMKSYEWDFIVAQTWWYDWMNKHKQFLSSFHVTTFYPRFLCYCKES